MLPVSAQADEICKLKAGSLVSQDPGLLVFADIDPNKRAILLGLGKVTRTPQPFDRDVIVLETTKSERYRRVKPAGAMGFIEFWTLFDDVEC